MKVLVTGAGGLIGSAACNYFLDKNRNILGIDNNTRKTLFGEGGDVTPVIKSLVKNSNYIHENCDITDRDNIERIVRNFKPDALIHCAAQPSHDKAASIPHLDFNINANGTLNLLEACRKFAKNCVFIHVSTNKVYGDGPNFIDIVEKEKRYDYRDPEYLGISETFSIDRCTHSLFGASKLAGDILAQEYGKYFGMPVGVFRGGCLTGPQHAGVELHGFLSYITDCAIKENHYTIFGYKGKQVRDQIHCNDVIRAFDNFIQNPKNGEVYNIGGCRQNSASILEIIDMIKELSSKDLNFSYDPTPRKGDHICYYSDMSKFKKDYPSWNLEWTLKDIVEEIIYEKSRKKI